MTLQVGDVMRATAKMSIGTDDYQNVYHFEAQGTGTLTDVQARQLCAQLIDDAMDDIDLLFVDELNFDTIEVYNLTQDTYLGEQTWPTLTVGGDLGDMLPPQTCQHVQFNTAVLGSSGRKFLPPTSDNYLAVDGTPVAGALANLATYAATLIAGLTSGTITIQPGNYQIPTASFIQWVLAIVPDFFSTQRRRYYGKGS